MSKSKVSLQEAIEVLTHDDHSVSDVADMVETLGNDEDGELVTSFTTVDQIVAFNTLKEDNSCDNLDELLKKAQEDEEVYDAIKSFIDDNEIDWKITHSRDWSDTDDNPPTVTISYEYTKVYTQSCNG